MTGGLALGIVALAFGGLTGLACVLQWQGRLGRGNDPDSLLERGYLLTPIPLAFILLGLLIILGELGVDWSRGVTGAVFGLILLIGLPGIVLWAWQPKWLRPAWQKRQIEGRASRARTAAGRYAVDVVAGGEPVRAEVRYDDVTSATTAAHSALDAQDAATYATVVDTRTDAAVRVIER